MSLAHVVQVVLLVAGALVALAAIVGDYINRPRH